MNFPAKNIPLVVAVVSSAMPTTNTRYETRSEIFLPNRSARKLEVKAPMTALYEKVRKVRSLLNNCQMWKGVAHYTRAS
jgi:hypothetical protein